MHSPSIQTHKWPRKKDLEFKASLGYTARPLVMFSKHIVYTKSWGGSPTQQISRSIDQSINQFQAGSYLTDPSLEDSTGPWVILPPAVHRGNTTAKIQRILKAMSFTFLLQNLLAWLLNPFLSDSRIIAVLYL